MCRREILDRLRAFARGLDHETRLTVISLLLASWAWQDDRFPDQVQVFREEVLCRLAHPDPRSEAS